MKKHKVSTTHNEVSHNETINKELSRMNRRDLQRACILRGLSFEDAVGFDNHGLSNWFYRNFENGENPQLVGLYDIYIEDELKKRGHKDGDPMMHPCFRLGYVPVVKETPQISNLINQNDPKVQEALKKMSPPKREKDEQNIIKGTKKSLTYQLTKQGLSKEQVIEKVKEKFPDAQAKSITIWIARAKKEMA